MHRSNEKRKVKRLVVLVSALDHKRWGKLAHRAKLSTAEFVRQAVEEKVDRTGVGENGN